MNVRMPKAGTITSLELDGMNATKSLCSLNVTIFSGSLDVIAPSL